jgi:LmbE family N-acetylglucosaminyl deacetylase
MALTLAAPDDEVVVANGDTQEQAFARTKMLGIGAHPDDLELLSWHAIGTARATRSYAGVVVADGADSPRAGRFAAMSRGEMIRVRRAEQKRAAALGDYGALVLLGYPSADIKRAGLHAPLVDDLAAVLDAARPDAVFTHNPCDVHETHVAVFMHVVAAARVLPANARPRALYGCEVWGALDWLEGPERVTFDVSAHATLGTELVAVFESQIAGGKRYDEAALGRRRANATFSNPREVDGHAATEIAMDVSALMHDTSIDVHDYAMALLERARSSASARMRNLGRG